jgi:hypothetical protein
LPGGKGKDLLWAMDEQLKNLGFFGAGAFREKILLGIEKSQENVGTWLPEWQALQRAIVSPLFVNSTRITRNPIF